MVVRSRNNGSAVEEIARQLMCCPAAPYCESLVAAEALRFCSENKLSAELDKFGNILVQVQRARNSRPFILAAHLDHPGFVIREGLGRRKWAAEFLGGVADPFFKRGIPVKLMPGAVPARLAGRLDEEKRLFELRAEHDPEESPEFAVWDLPEFEVAAGRITGRACDDLIGAAAILSVMAKLARSKARVNVVGVLSRAEEVGFHGALALAKSGRLPKNGLLISLETSRELPGAQMHSGVVIRVGDRTSIFDSAGTRFLTEVAGALAREKKGFKSQRALMSGGTCEATAYQEFGYRSAAVCVALGNYHNCAPDGTIQAEYVSLADAQNMAMLLEQCALQMKDLEKITRKLPVRLNKSAERGATLLKKRQLSI